jgi:hypothetical protein
VSQSIPVPFCFLGPSWRHILKQSWKAMVIKHLLIFRAFRIRNPSVYLYVSIKHILTSWTSFMIIPNSIRMMYNPHRRSPVISSMSGVNLDRRMLYKMWYVVDNNGIPQ